MHLPLKKIAIAAALVALLTGNSPANTPTTKHPTAKSKSVHGASKRHRRSRRGAWKRHGQQKIDAARATEIQQALIREKYLDGTPSGRWDARTEAAMARYQTDNGWQSKVTPDSRALIKLGLGPRHESDLNRTGGDTVASTGATSSSAGKRQ